MTSGSEGKYCKVVKGFTIYEHGSRLGQLTLTFYTQLLSSFKETFLINFGFHWKRGFGVLFFFFLYYNFMVMCMYLAPMTDNKPPEAKIS